MHQAPDTKRPRKCLIAERNLKYAVLSVCSRGKGNLSRRLVTNCRCLTDSRRVPDFFICFRIGIGLLNADAETVNTHGPRYPDLRGHIVKVRRCRNTAGLCCRRGDRNTVYSCLQLCGCLNPGCMVRIDPGVQRAVQQRFCIILRISGNTVDLIF